MNINSIHLRAKILAQLRDFFAKKNIIEVETPLLYHTTNPSPYLNSFNLDNLYLQTSPEFAMKILLAANSGDIYQICKAFRKDEIGRLHKQEFTILEWYRLGFNHHDLMDEINELLKLILKTKNAKRVTYQEIFAEFLNIDPHKINISQLKIIAKKHELNISSPIPDDYDIWLQLLFTHLIEPKLGPDYPVFVYDFPASQAMLARIRKEENEDKLASRFEVYFKGIELANGFHELNNVDEQRERFLADLTKRKEMGLPQIPLDENLLSSLPNLPNCSGVAVGLDRLIMLAANANSLQEILCFS
jgi:elongation factor P--(R)-beta-lysine ligase